ncbi:uncharacterized protein LOC129755897 [Uranotaenia lowii]|uniref:uncharacterized protein LOC129755897 n=1 Tax=Uranotaenia lowii TaxID=190385 RepID=UPI00247B03ED|nr:uncharacterized protein LOC129755897 [Uranotaenia lowii]
MENCSLLRVEWLSLVLCCVVALQFSSKCSAAKDVLYEGFEQYNGTEVGEFILRVKKLNRTTSALFGTINLKKDLGADHNIDINFFHSPKGNQQFNHYPMKIPKTNMCDFTKNVFPDYEKYYKDVVDNIFQVGDCPITAREMTMNNHILDSNMFSPYNPSGLWRAVIKVEDSSGEGFTVAWTMNAYGENYFG